MNYNMIGKLIKRENKWVVQYKMDSDLIATDGGEIPIHPEYAKSYFLDEEDVGKEVEFEMIDEFIEPELYQNIPIYEGQIYAKLKK